MDDILRQAERLYYGTNGLARRSRIQSIANRYLENTAKANNVNAREIIDRSIIARMYGDSELPTQNISATRRQRMGLSNG